MKKTNAGAFKSIQELKIYRQGVHVGDLQRTSQGCKFQFTKEFIKDDRFSGLAHGMPKQAEPYQQIGVNLFPFFAGLLPEGLRLKTLIETLKTSQDDLFTLLAAIGHTCIGDVYAVAHADARGSGAERQIPKVSEVDFYELFEESMRVDVFREESAFAGVQEKISASMISFPVRIAAKNKFYILKLNPKDKGQLVQNEHHCLLLAARCGLNVNRSQLIEDKNKIAGLLIERFDRQIDAQSGQTLLCHQEDACQYLNMYPADKYRLSLREISEGMEQYCTAPLIDILKLIEIYAFSYLIGNGDLHAKNISIRTDTNTGRSEITPAYDLICTYIHEDHNMALKLDGRDNKIKRRDILRFGKHFDLNPSAAIAMLDHLLKKFVVHKSLLFSFPMESRQRIALEKMVQSRMGDLS